MYKMSAINGFKTKSGFSWYNHYSFWMFWRVLSPKMLQNVPRCNSAKNQPLYKHGIHIIEKERNQHKQMSMFFWNPHEFKLPRMWKRWDIFNSLNFLLLFRKGVILLERWHGSLLLLLPPTSRLTRKVTTSARQDIDTKLRSLHPQQLSNKED